MGDWAGFDDDDDDEDVQALKVGHVKNSLNASK